MKFLLVVSSLLFLVSCISSAVPDRDYQKRAAKKSDQELDREVKKYND